MLIPIKGEEAGVVAALQNKLAEIAKGMLAFKGEGKKEEAPLEEATTKDQ